MPRRSVVDCSNLANTELKSNNDISGTGVVISFVGTGYLVLLLLICNYAIAHDPRSIPFQLDEYSAGRCRVEYGAANPIDIGFLRCIRGYGRRALTYIPKSASLKVSFLNLGPKFNECIINFCDIQILTSFGILTSGYMSLGYGLSAYHWQIIVYLAWFSTVTHISGLTVIRSHLHNHPWKKNIRFGMMFGVLAMLIVALIPTRYFNWAAAFTGSVVTEASPAICFFGFRSFNQTQNTSTCPMEMEWNAECKLETSSAFETTVFSIILLVFSFFTRSVKIFMPLSRIVNKGLRRPISTLAQRLLAKLGPLGGEPLPIQRTRATPRRSFREDLWLGLLTRPALALFLTLRLFADLYGSMLAEIYWLISILLWGTFKLQGARYALQNDVLEEESQWTFGQILSLLLLASPVFQTVSTFTTATTPHNFPQPERLVNTEPGVESRDHNDTQTPPLHGIAPPDWLSRDYYTTAPWLGPCIVALCCLVMMVTMLAFLGMFNFDETLFMVLFSPMSTLTQFWIDGGMLAMVLFGFPGACAATIALGLGLDPWFKRPSSMKRWVMFCLCAAIYALYVMFPVFWNWQVLYFGFTHWIEIPVSLIPTVALYTLYAVMYVGMTLFR